MREIGERDAFCDAPLEQCVDARRAARRELHGVGCGAQVVREAGRIKHEFSGLVARIVGAVAEADPRAAQRPRRAGDGGADGLGRGVG